MDQRQNKKLFALFAHVEVHYMQKVAPKMEFVSILLILLFQTINCALCLCPELCNFCFIQTEFNYSKV